MPPSWNISWPGIWFRYENLWLRVTQCSTVPVFFFCFLFFSIYNLSKILVQQIEISRIFLFLLFSSLGVILPTEMEYSLINLFLFNYYTGTMLIYFFIVVCGEWNQWTLAFENRNFIACLENGEKVVWFWCGKCRFSIQTYIWVLWNVAEHLFFALLLK